MVRFPPICGWWVRWRCSGAAARASTVAAAATAVAAGAAAAVSVCYSLLFCALIRGSRPDHIRGVWRVDEVPELQPRPSVRLAIS
jgi:hypothetical protein